MVQRGFPPNMSHHIILQILAQSDKEIQSDPSANEALIVARVNVI